MSLKKNFFSTSDIILIKTYLLLNDHLYSNESFNTDIQVSFPYQSPERVILGLTHVCLARLEIKIFFELKKKTFKNICLKTYTRFEILHFQIIVSIMTGNSKEMLNVYA